MPSDASLVQSEDGHVSHPLVTSGMLEDRNYQLDLVRSSRDRHTLVTLPTGLGKTTVSLLLTAERLHAHGGKSLMLAPTKPLVQQHAEFYREALDIYEDEVVVFTGDVRPGDRADLWKKSTVVIATPQVIENDLVSNRIDLADVTHCTFDECHRATGDYAYNYIAERYHQDAETPLVTAMSASPGEDRDGILEVCGNLGIENVEVRTEEDSDVADYTYETEIDWKEVALPEELLEIRDALESVIKDRMSKLKEMGIANSATKDVSHSDLNRMRGECRKLMDNDDSAGYKGMSVVTEVNKLNGAVKELESQGVEAFVSYMERNVEEEAQSSGGSKASKRLAGDETVQEAIRDARQFDDPHPKLVQARDHVVHAVAGRDDPRVLVFTESRDTAETLTDFLGEYLDSHRFVGQSDKENSEGMSQSEQKDVLDRFKDGEFDVLVSTSVAEEGLDVPEVDLVLFYEPVPESVRTIQRRGRTGRQREGKVTILMATDNRDGKGGNTTDETFYWIAQRRESTMEDEIQEMKEMEDEIMQELLDDTEQAGLDEFAGDEDAGAEADADGSVDDVAAAADEVADDDDADDDDEEPVETAEPDADAEETHIVADQREMDSKVPRKLSTMEGVETRVETLEVGDFILSDRVAVERKEVDDFLSSIIDGERDVFQQVKEIADHYERPLVIIEGEGLYSSRNIHPNAIRAAIASLAVDFNASVLRTEDTDDTAELLETIATREQEDNDNEVSLHGSKDARTMAEQQEYVVSSIADIGPVTAGRLLDEFDTVRAVMNASAEELEAVEGIGEVTADRITEVVTSDYDG